MSSLSNAQRRPIDSKEEVPKRVGPGRYMIPVEVLAGRVIKAADEIAKRGDVPTLTAISDLAGMGRDCARQAARHLRETGRWTYGDYDNKREPTKAEVVELLRGKPLPKRVERANRREQEIAYILRREVDQIEVACRKALKDWREARDGCKGLRDEVKRRLEAKHDRHLLPAASVDCSGGRVGCAGDPGVDLVREGA